MFIQCIMGKGFMVKKSLYNMCYEEEFERFHIMRNGFVYSSNGRAAGESGDGRGGRSGGNHRKRASVDTKSTERQEIKFTEVLYNNP